jgi:ribonuclease HII
MNPLNAFYKSAFLELGCDEAGRGCLAGPVVAAAVILNPEAPIEGLNDSKKINEKTRMKLAEEIKSKAAYYAIEFIDHKRIDAVNILNASIEAMHQCILTLSVKPNHIIVDGNRFKPIDDIPFTTIVKGDSKFQSIAAASILAKTARDQYMLGLHNEYPEYGWNENKGYPTIRHKLAIEKFGLSPFHRLTFQHALTVKQLTLFD